MRGKPGLISVNGDGSFHGAPGAAPVLLEALRALGRERRGNGTGLPPIVVELADWFTVATELGVTFSQAQIGSANGTRSVPQQADRSLSAGQDLVDLEEASAMLGPSEAYLRRQCRQGKFVTARKVGGAWQIARAEVVARRPAQKESA